MRENSRVLFYSWTLLLAASAYSMMEEVDLGADDIGTTQEVNNIYDITNDRLNEDPTFPIITKIAYKIEYYKLKNKISKHLQNNDNKISDQELRKISHKVLLRELRAQHGPELSSLWVLTLAILTASTKYLLLGFTSFFLPFKFRLMALFWCNG